MSAQSESVHELAPAKLNLVLHVGPRRPDGLHPICSIFASLDLADEVEVHPTEGDVHRDFGFDGTLAGTYWD
jgi:4-diphosphocytidyl-2-C-methyl-D-erythritol kinase